MADRSGSHMSTRQRVLESACEVFADKGFHDATIHDICERAQANIASVNYYFGDKDQLYREVWRLADELARRKYDIPRDIESALPAEERLYHHVLRRIQCIFDEGLEGCFAKLLARELLKPSPALEEIVLEALQPRLQKLHQVVAELLGSSASQRQVHHCTMSVIAQCAHLNFSRAIREVFHRIHEGKEPHHEHPSPEQIARHIADFSLAGIRHYREQLEKEGAHGQASQ